MKFESAKHLIRLTFILLLLAGCSSGPAAPADVRAGEWTASTDFGSVTLVVNESGTAITEAVVEYECGSGGMNFTETVTITPTEGFPIENNKFDMDFETVQIKIQGEFSSDNTKVSGTLTARSCSGKWDTNR